MMARKMKIKKLKERHLDALRQLRNKNRQWFFNKSTITPTQQQAWYNSIRNDTKIRFYIIEVEDEVAGSLSLTKTKEGIEIGNVLLDNRFRGQGIMTKAIRKLIKNKNKDFFARILLENIDSQNLFERCGFTKVAYIMEIKC